MSAAFCSRCATPMAPALLGGKERSRCPACGFVLWRNPAPVTLTVVEHEQQLLLIRRALAPLKGYWAPPGGYVECGESLPEAAIREVREETALEPILSTDFPWQPTTLRNYRYSSEVSCLVPPRRSKTLPPRNGFTRSFTKSPPLGAE